MSETLSYGCYKDREDRVLHCFFSQERPGDYVISSASLLIAAAIRNSDWSVTVSEDISELGEGYRDAASAARLVLPGKCSIRKYQGRVRCLRRKDLVLDISSRVRSPKTFGEAYGL